MERLTIITGPLRDKTFDLPSVRDWAKIIGRGKDGVEFQIPDAAISRKHAELSFRDGQWALRDLGSSNGTFLNELRVQAVTLLSHKDQIRCGATVFLFEQASTAQTFCPPKAPNEPVELVFDPGETMVAIAFDALQSKQTARQQKRAIEAGQAALNMSHGVKNILQAVQTGQNVMDDAFSYNDIEQARRAWNILKRNLDKIQKTVLDMLKFSREMTPKLQPCQFNRLIESVVEILRPQADQRQVHLTLQVDEYLGQVSVDPDQMQDVAMNLILNALEAVPVQTGHVVVHTEWEKEASEVLLRVSDNGHGVLDKKTLFEPFHTDKQGYGTGLGLAISKKIIQQHHGYIDVQSIPGEGSIFTVHIPAKAQ